MKMLETKRKLFRNAVKIYRKKRGRDDEEAE